MLHIVTMHVAMTYNFHFHSHLTLTEYFVLEEYY